MSVPPDEWTMDLGSPVVPEEYIIYKGWSNGSCSNDISVASSSIKFPQRIELEIWNVFLWGSRYYNCRIVKKSYLNFVNKKMCKNSNQKNKKKKNN